MKTSSNRRMTLLAAPLLLLGACISEDSALDEDTSSAQESEEGDDSDEGAGEQSDEGDEPETTGEAEAANDSCSYTSLFTGASECRDYLGAGWSSQEVSANCDSAQGELSPGEVCASEDVLGRCTLDGGTDFELDTLIYGTDASSCALQATGCENFGGGEWKPEPICEGTGGEGGGGDESVFIQPTLECTPPLEGEPEGQGPEGEVCTWQAIAGSTEEGRHFEDYASCDVVRSQRPYYGAPPAAPTGDEDPRLEDAAYVAELDWVRSQVESSACICCHSEGSAGGPSNWYVEAEGNWMDSFYDSGLALGANWINSVSFGAYEPADNNGFNRIDSGIPSTDPDRMVAFFVAELEHRGRSPEDFGDSAPFGGPLYDQLVYEPEACENGEGIGVDGTIAWTGGPARYVYVLEADATSPTVPPNLDLPEGTLWRIDVPWDGGEPISSGEVDYGAPPTGMSQRFPALGGPQGLVPGNDYYLYVSRDVGVPITRCVFTYE